MADHVHLLKLCVGADRVEDLVDWQASRRWPQGRPVHVTRMWPKRADQVLAGGSLYWVFRGLILARQRIVALDQVTGADGITRCAIALDRQVVRTESAPRRPFQGWRYLDPADAPRDLGDARLREDPLPDSLARALADLGLR
ncbi:MAG: DUF1489 domain-containing protein [Rhodobacterales bacterium]|nr:DUF1489 domain-containing protein [Rhodobacterales bacterium]